MRLLLDNGLPRSAVSLLRADGHDTVHVGDISLAGAPDQLLLDHARSERRVVVTLDADFHTLLALSAASAPSVVRIRIEGLRAPDLAALLGRVVLRFAVELQAGAAISGGRGEFAVAYFR